MKEALSASPLEVVIRITGLSTGSQTLRLNRPRLRFILEAIEGNLRRKDGLTEPFLALPLLWSSGSRAL
jgi:hypothetical protein